MQNSNSPSPWGPPPIPSPDAPRPAPGPGNYRPAQPSIDRSSFKNAPPIVRSARLLSVLGIAGAFVVAGLGFFDLSDPKEAFMGPVYMVLAVVQLAVSIWLYAGISKGIRSAWTVQIVYSAFGLMGFPLGTLINGYLLSQWFSDDTKAWFGA